MSVFSLLIYRGKLHIVITMFFVTLIMSFGLKFADIRRSTRPFLEDKKEDDFFQIDVRFSVSILNEFGYWLIID